MRQKGFKFRPEQCPTCAYFIDWEGDVIKGECEIEDPRVLLVDEAKRACPHYEKGGAKNGSV